MKDAEQFFREVSKREDAVLGDGTYEFPLGLGEPDDVIKLEPNKPTAAKGGKKHHTHGLGSYLRSEIAYDGQVPGGTIRTPRWSKGKNKPTIT